MHEQPRQDQADQGNDFDYSTPEALRAMADVSALVLEVRESSTEPLARKVRLYERTLGLAVIPVLVRRAFLVAARALKRQR